MTMESTPTVLLTDRGWPEDSVERQVIEAAGLALVNGDRMRQRPRPWSAWWGSTNPWRS
jgi:hypothetical protein